MENNSANESTLVTVRMFGVLHSLRRSRGLATTVELELPPEGRTAREIALDLELPLDRIEAVFCNHRTYELDHRVHPGDRVAFVPPGVPGPHRFFLGIHQAGQKTRAEEER